MKIPASLLSSFDRNETAQIDISPGFTVTLCENNVTNPMWGKRARDFIQSNPGHPAAGDKFSEFIRDLRQNITQSETTDFIADVLIVDWQSDELKYSPKNARELLRKLPRMADNILLHASIESNYRNAEVEQAVGE